MRISQIDSLIRDKILPEDSIIISTHNNIITSSELDRTVSRIADLDEMRTREDPGNLIFSHKISWDIGRSYGVLPPLSGQPIVHDNVVVSTYEKLITTKEWTSEYGESINTMLNSFHSFPVEELKYPLRQLNIEAYASERIKTVDRDDLASARNIGRISNILCELDVRYPFQELLDEDSSIVHGDIHSGNIVNDCHNTPYLIDLDSVAIGPRLYDIASWMFRTERGEFLPGSMLTRVEKNDEERVRALIGWKAVSSLSHVLRYEKRENQDDEIDSIIWSAHRLGVDL